MQLLTVWWLLDRRCLSRGPGSCSAGSVTIVCPDRAFGFCYCDAEWKGLLCSLGMGLSTCLVCSKPCVQRPALHKRGAAVCTCDPGTRFSRGGDCFSLIPSFVRSHLTHHIHEPIPTKLPLKLTMGWLWWCTLRQRQDLSLSLRPAWCT